MLRARETLCCLAESWFIGIDFAEATHCSFFFNPLKRSLDFARDDKNTIFLSAHLSCWTSRSISLCLHFLYLFWLVFRQSLFVMIFLFRCKVSVMLFGKSIACIAIHLGIVRGLQILRPYGAESGLRCSLFVARCSLFVVRCSWIYCHVLTPFKLD